LHTKAHEITYNVKKSAVMCIKPKLLQDLLVPEFELCGNGSKVKYLGVFITDELQDDDDISREISSIYVRGNMLIKCLNTVQRMSKPCFLKHSVLVFIARKYKMI
jgi:hypothetical protein